MGLNMGYARRPDFDEPTAEDKDRERSVILWVIPLIMLHQAIHLGAPDATTTSLIYHTVSWLLFAIAILWMLAGWPQLGNSQRDRLVINDEGQRAIRAEAMRWGMIAVVLIGCVLMIATNWIPLTARTSINALVSGAMVTAALRLAWLNRADPAEDE